MTTRQIEPEIRRELRQLMPGATVKENLIVAPKAAAGRRKKKGAARHE